MLLAVVARSRLTLLHACLPATLPCPALPRLLLQSRSCSGPRASPRVQRGQQRLRRQQRRSRAAPTTSCLWRTCQTLPTRRWWACSFSSSQASRRCVRCCQALGHLALAAVLTAFTCPVACRHSRQVVVGLLAWLPPHTQQQHTSTPACLAASALGPTHCRHPNPAPHSLPARLQVRMVPARPGIAFVEYEDAPQAGVAMQGLQGFKLASGGWGWVGGGDMAPAQLHTLLFVSAAAAAPCRGA